MSNAPIHQQPNTANDDTGAASIRERALQQEKPSSRCYICDKPSHRAVDCRDLGKRRCLKCQTLGNEAKDCCSPVGTSMWERSQKTPYRAGAEKDHKDGLKLENRTQPVDYGMTLALKPANVYWGREQAPNTSF